MGFFRKLRNMGAKNRSAREWYDHGVSLAGEGDLAETHDALKRALAANPDTAELCIKIGLSLDGLNDAESAAEAFRRACQIDPRAIQAHLQLCQLMMKHGRPDHALKPMREALQLADYSADACIRYANVLERLNEVEEAMCYYHLAAEASPSDVDMQRHLGRILLRAGHFAGSIRAWRRVLELTPNDLAAMTQLGIALSQYGQHEAAIKLLTIVARARPDSAEAYSDLGLTLSRSGSHEAAIHSLKQAITLKARSPQLHLNLGVALMAAGRLEEAVAAYWDVVALAPDWSVAHFNVGMALRELGDKDGAKNALQKAAQIAPDDPDVAAALRELAQPPKREAPSPTPPPPAPPSIPPASRSSPSQPSASASQVSKKTLTPPPPQRTSGERPPIDKRPPDGTNKSSKERERDVESSYENTLKPELVASEMVRSTVDLHPPKATSDLPRVRDTSEHEATGRIVSNPQEDTRKVAIPEATRQELARTISDSPPPPAMPSGGLRTAPSVTPTPRERNAGQKSITGEIELFPIAEVLEFLKVHRSTGVLRVTSEYGQGELRMREGNLTGGSSPSTKDMISLLVGLGLVSDGEVNGKYSAEAPELIGASMVEDGLITPETLRKASMIQIESALTELVSWKKGDFTFRAERISEKESEISVDTRGALMDVLRKLDESKWAASKG